MIAEIVSLSAYDAQVSKLMDEDERLALEFFIACSPEDHPVIAGTGGFRKARWARPGKGKSGGFRIIYYFAAEGGRIYLASIYAKSRKGTLTATDRSVLAKLAGEIKKVTRGTR